MTEHTHSTVVPGCYRCELGRDEEFSAMAEDFWDFEAEPTFIKLGLPAATLHQAKVKFVSPPWKPETVTEVTEWWHKNFPNGA